MSDYYWVGDSGDWSDYNNHWSDTSGGGTGVMASPPTINDWVIFDDNSFSASGTVNIDVDAEAGIFRANTVTNNPTFLGTTSLQIGNIMSGGEFTLGTLGWDFTGDVYIRGNTPLTSAGNTLNNAIYIGASGEYGELTLQDSLTCGYISLDIGLVDFNNKNVTAIAIDAPLGSAGTMLFGNGTFTIDQLQFNNAVDYTAKLDLGGANILVGTTGFNFGDVGTVTDFSAGSSNIYLTGDEIIFAGGGLTYNKVYLQGGSITVTGDNVFDYLELGAGKLYKFANTSIQYLNTVSFDGSGTADLTTIRSTTDNIQFSLLKSSGTVEAQYIDIKDSNATGGAMFIARDSTDSGNNTGWGFGGYYVTLSDNIRYTDNIDYTYSSYRGLTLGKKPHIDSVINLQPKAGYRYSYKVRKN